MKRKKRLTAAARDNQEITAWAVRTGATKAQVAALRSTKLVLRRLRKMEKQAAYERALKR